MLFQRVIRVPSLTNVFIQEGWIFPLDKSHVLLQVLDTAAALLPFFSFVYFQDRTLISSTIVDIWAPNGALLTGKLSASENPFCKPEKIPLPFPLLKG